MKKLLITLAIIGAAYALFSYVNLEKTQENVKSDDTATANSTNTDLDKSVSSAKSSLISDSPSNADVFILEPGDGATVSSPLTIKFGVANMTIAAAGENIDNSGHHHLLLNLETLPDLSTPLPANENIIHFGKGQTETTINLQPGQHSLQLLLGNYLHIPHNNPVLSKKIMITVE